MPARWLTLAATCATLAGCANPALSAPGPNLDPLAFFTGHQRSWGVVENRSGAPTAVITTDCRGEAEGPDGLHMVQYLTIGHDAPTRREWHMRRTGPTTYDATANDMVGTAHGVADGRSFHWRWVLATSPGNPLLNVAMHQWMYRMDDGSVVNRTTITKLGITLAEVTERFAPAS